MAEDRSDSKLPALVAFGLVVLGLVIAAAHGLVHGSVGGGVIAAAGALPGLFGMWKGIQQDTQGTLAVSVIAVIASLAAGAALIVLGIIHWAT
jgi:hypothetical protein